MLCCLKHNEGGTNIAITKILRRSARPDKLVAYAINPRKTDEGTLTASLNCTIPMAAQEMQRTREKFCKTDNTQIFHIIQSFAPGEITPQEALELAQAFAQEHLADYQVVIGTHQDHEHIHSHIVFNAVSFVDGKKYHSTPQTYYRQVRAISDRLCREHGLSIVMDDGEHHRAMSYAEWKAAQDGGLSLRQVVARDVQEVLSYALDYGEFLAFMEGKGYEIRHGKYMSFRPYGYERFIRPQLDGVKCTEDAIRAHIEGELENPAAQVLVPRPYRPYPKPIIGVVGIYRHWLYVLGCYAKHKGMPVQSAFMRTELWHFEKIKEQHRYLLRKGVSTAEELEERVGQLRARLETLTKTRTILNTQKKRKSKLYTAFATVEQFSPVADLFSDGTVGTTEEQARWRDAQALLKEQDTDQLRREKAELYQCIADVNQQMREIRVELRMCESIARTAPQLQEQLRAIREENSIGGDFYEHERW